MPEASPAGITKVVLTDASGTPYDLTGAGVAGPESMCPLGAGGETNFSRMQVNQNSTPMASGVILFGPANVAQVSETVTAVSCLTGGTATAGATFCGYGVWTAAANGDLTQVAHTNSNTSLWNVNFQGFFGINVKQALTAPLAKVAGTTYVVGALMVGTTPPTIGGDTPSSGEAATNLLVPMRGAKSAAGQTTILAAGNIVYGSLVASSFAPFFALLP